MEQSGRWDEFYRGQSRAWRGVTDLGELPFPEGSRILETGCGNGKTFAALAERGYKVAGIDFSEEAVNACKRILGDVDVRVGSVLDIPFEDSEFDGLTMYHVLENIDVPDYPKVVSEIARVLKSGSYAKICVFSADDMRSEKGERVDERTVIRGNGIRYHYFTEDELKDVFTLAECVSIRTVTKDTRFGTVRSRIEAVFRF